MADSVRVDPPTRHTSTGRERVFSPVVDQHATWIAVNPIQGCPKACTYCFLNDRGQTAVHPQTLATPAESVDLLVASRYYAPVRPVAFYTWTDVMALPDSRAHLIQMLGVLADRQVPNPLVLITKCHVPDDVIDAIRRVRDAGVMVLVYVSYSGLDRDIERGIRRDAVAANFPRLADAGIPVVHYWRPAFPASATEETMTAVFDHASAYARCTVAAGLKVEPAALERLTPVWPQLADTPGVTEAECVYPQAFWRFIHRTWQRRPGYPVFHTNACALSYLLARPDTSGIFGSSVCRLRNVCPIVQRERCTRADADRTPPTTDDVRAALAYWGLPDAPFTLVEGRELVIQAAVATNTAAALTHDLGLRIRVVRDGADPYWSSGTAGATPVILP